MGVDWFSCSACDDTFNDCGPYGWCVCEDRLCGDCLFAFKEKYGTVDTVGYGEVCNGCDTCKLVTPSAFDLLAFALTKLKMSRSELEDALRAAVASGEYHLNGENNEDDEDADED